MKRIAIFGLAAAAILAIAVTGAFGAAAKLTLKTAKGPLAKNAELLSVSHNVVTVTSKGSLECGTVELKATLEKNTNAKDKGKINTGNNFGGGKEPATECKSSLGSAKFTDTKLPWKLELSAKGTGVVAKARFEGEFTELGGVKCTYEAKKDPLTFATSGALVLKTKEAQFKIQKGSNAACPSEGKLSGEFAVTSGGETVEAEL